MFQRYPEAEAVELLREKHRRRVWVVEASTDSGAALRIVELARLAADPVFTIHKFEDAGSVLESARAGVAGFLMEPLDRASIECAYLKAGNADPGPPPEDIRTGSELHCFVGLSGSCGTSTAAAAHTTLWSRRTKGKLLLADLDPITGIQAFLWKIKPKYSFVDALQRANELDNDIWNGLLCRAGGIDILAAPERADASVEGADPTGLLRFARKCYPRIVVDAGIVNKPWALATAAESDKVFLVARSHGEIAVEVERALHCLKESGVSPAKVHLILNRWVSRRDGGMPEFTNRGVAQLLRIPEETALMHNAVLEGQNAPPKSELSRALSRSLTEACGVAVPSTPKRGGLLGFLARLFGKRSK